MMDVLFKENSFASKLNLTTFFNVIPEFYSFLWDYVNNMDKYLFYSDPYGYLSNKYNCVFGTTISPALEIKLSSLIDNLVKEIDEMYIRYFYIEKTSFNENFKKYVKDKELFKKTQIITIKSFINCHILQKLKEINEFSSFMTLTLNRNLIYVECDLNDFDDIINKEKLYGGFNTTELNLYKSELIKMADVFFKDDEETKYSFLNNYVFRLDNFYFFTPKKYKNKVEL